MKYRVCLGAMYSCGLRLKEGLHLQVGDIDRDRLQIHVCHGKGGKERYVPLPEQTLKMLRQYWVTHRHSEWLFPVSTPRGIPQSKATAPMDPGEVQRAFRAACQASGVQKQATVHTLRHLWATHMLEAGVNLRIIMIAVEIKCQGVAVGEIEQTRVFSGRFSRGEGETRSPAISCLKGRLPSFGTAQLASYGLFSLLDITRTGGDETALQ